MTDQTLPPPAADARFSAVLREIADRTLDQTGEGRNGDVFIAYKLLPAGANELARPEPMSASEWLDDVLGMFLREPGDQLRAMLAARARLGENLHLIKDIDIARLRGFGVTTDQEEAMLIFEQIGALFDFVAEVRQIAKDI